ncbi:aldo/keto reductase [Arthrobacter sp. 18067]|uniref:aldo/keto reductase n=1 Tax=Arthrobacter sp. 18067 TaxID=2681413 RepID=UPI00190FA710|nr:aldo/keto reductase [Arthrobacter sp. 18067]
MTTRSGMLTELPNTDLTVSALCLGGNRLGSELDQAASFDLLDTFFDLGGNFIDTALVYADWNQGIERSCSERTIGRWLGAQDRSKLVIATKGGHPALDNPGVSRLDRGNLRDDAHRSIENLGGTPLDLYYLHRDDATRPIAEILETLEELVSDGLIRHYAASNFSAARLTEAAAWATANDVPGFVAHQLEWSLAQPRHDAVMPDLTWMDEELLTLHEEQKLTAIPYSSQARGYFDKALPDQPVPASVHRYDTVRNASALKTVTEIAHRLDVDKSTVALAGLLQTPLTTVPVIGCRTLEQLRSSWAALDLDLSAEDRERLAAHAMAGQSS